MARLAAANHPQLWDRGWHPTAVGGVVGAGTATAALLELDAEQTGHAVRLALLRAGGLRAAFGSDGKSRQVGLAAAAGDGSAVGGRRGHREYRCGLRGRRVRAGVWRAVVEPVVVDGAPLAVRENWIAAYPCCLQTPGAIEAAGQARTAGVGTPPEIVVTVHPVSRTTASLGPDVTDGLQAKFSIPYLTAFTLLHGPPRASSFTAVDDDARRLPERVQVPTDATLLEALLEVDGERGSRRGGARFAHPADGRGYATSEGGGPGRQSDRRRAR
jgi:2-methylcitrate dehydratase PrpD